MERSRFCVCPQGDSTYTKRFFDSLLAGCVPVVFADAETFFRDPAFAGEVPNFREGLNTRLKAAYTWEESLAFADEVDYRSLVVIFPPNDTVAKTFVDSLLAIGDDDYATIAGRVASARARVLYHASAVGDAFESLWNRVASLAAA